MGSTGIEIRAQMRLKNGKNPRNSIKRELFWGIKTAREYARIKIDGLRLVGGNPDFTNAPGHGDDDARFYDRQQAHVTVHARGGLPRKPSPGQILAILSY